MLIVVGKASKTSRGHAFRRRKDRPNATFEARRVATQEVVTLVRSETREAFELLLNRDFFFALLRDVCSVECFSRVPVTPPRIQQKLGLGRPPRVTKDGRQASRVSSFRNAFTEGVLS